MVFDKTRRSIRPGQLIDISTASTGANGIATAQVLEVRERSTMIGPGSASTQPGMVVVQILVAMPIDRNDMVQGYVIKEAEKDPKPITTTDIAEAEKVH